MELNIILLAAVVVVLHQQNQDCQPLIVMVVLVAVAVEKIPPKDLVLVDKILAEEVVEVAPSQLNLVVPASFSSHIQPN
jgi:hypothetical protein